MVDTQLEALAVETRRLIYRLIVERPRSVAELAAELPVSRPAVSQHLKVLLDAELARVTSVGAKRVYSADPTGVGLLREWVDRMWEEALASFADLARREKERAMEPSEQTGIEPLIKTIVVPGEPGWTFELFTSRIDEWWPKTSHSVAGDEARQVLVDPGRGGRVYEVTSDGEEHDWGSITDWEPGRLLAFTWHPGQPTAQSTRVEITFRQTSDGTEVTLVHDGWEARGESAAAMRAGYDQGWDFVLGQIPGSVPVEVVPG